MLPTPPSTPHNEFLEPKRRTPDGVDVNWVADQVGWPIPVWIERDLYDAEFKKDAGQLVLNMFNYARNAIDKAMATAAGDEAVIEFKYWRKLSEKATKMKPTRLKMSLFKHPQYERIWMLVEYA